MCIGQSRRRSITLSADDAGAAVLASNHFLHLGKDNDETGGDEGARTPKELEEDR